MGTCATAKRAAVSRERGFSLLELILALTIVLILAAVALPDFARAYRIYQLNSNASRLASVLKLTRFAAIRRNSLVDFRIQQTGADWLTWSDPDRDGVADSTETQAPVIGPISLVPAGTPPNPAAITAALGGGGLNTLSGGNATVTFDARGAIVFAGAPQIYVLYLGNTAYPDYGYRAVVLLPSGVTQVWSAPANGPWSRTG